MIFRAKIQNSLGNHQVVLQTGERTHSIQIPSKPSGSGSDVNGAELLFLALATCYGNDIYREAAVRGIQVEQVEVDVEGEFGTEGEPAKNVTYQARVTARASEAEIRELMVWTDRVAEIQNSLRAGMPVTLAGVEAVSVR